MHYQDALEQELEELGMELRKLPSVAPAVMDQVVADAAAPKAMLARRESPSRTKMAVLVTLAAVAATVVFAVTLPGLTQVAFGQVLENARNARTVAFRLREGSEAVGNEDKVVAEGTRYRVEHSSGVVIVGDSESRKQLLRDPKDKTAALSDLSEHAADEMGIGVVEQLRQIQTDDAKPGGTETIDGKTLEVFEVKGVKLFGFDSDKGTMKIWVDPKSELPWRIELRMGSSPIVTLREIAWNVPVEAFSLQMRIPGGYSEQAVEEFTKRLRPGRAPTGRPLTPTEAFRKWSDDNK
jgi:hypothetical protein